MKPTFFRTPSDFRQWLRKNHATARELWVGFYAEFDEPYLSQFKSDKAAWTFFAAQPPS